ncbi:MAG TPA: amidohydrolase family protein, partial [Ktedonobacteraceae bacterium]
MDIPFQPDADISLIHHVRVFDGERVIEHCTVLVENGKISYIDETDLHVSHAQVIDGRGRTLLPGLFDAHLHVPVDPEPTLRQLASFGITTALDMAGGGEKLRTIKRIQAEDLPDMADLRAAGNPALAPDSPLAKMSAFTGISHSEQVPSWMDTRIAEGSDFIKIVYDEMRGGPLSQEMVQAIVQAAHRHGKLVIVHALSEQKAREAIAAGADGLAHLFIGDTITPDFGQFAAEHHVFVIPTLMVLYGLCGMPQNSALLADPHLAPYIPTEQQQAPLWPTDSSQKHLRKATDEAMCQLIQAQVPLLAGTDTALITAKLGVGAYGATLHGELKLLVDEGMTPIQALIAATSAPARAFHLTDRGLIRAGMRADLVLVEGDPTHEILATRNIVAVWKRGKRVDTRHN